MQGDNDAEDKFNIQRQVKKNFLFVHEKMSISGKATN